MSSQNRAAWQMEKQATPLVVKEAPYPEPGVDELVIQTKALAFNIVDHYMQKAGIMLTEWPCIFGQDVAGVVQSVGTGEISQHFKPGDKAVGIGQGITMGQAQYSAFQEYVVLRLCMIAKLPDNVEFTDAAVLPLIFGTAASMLFDPETLALEMPPSDKGKGKTLVVWGASGGVGCNAVQLAVAAGYEVFGVASKSNFDLLTSLGAAKCFDYHDETIVHDLIAALTGKDVVGALDAIGKKDIVESLCQVVRASTGRKTVACVQFAYDNPDADGVKIVSNLKTMGDAFGGELGRKAWRDVLEPALAEGRYQYKPTAEIVGHGLEAVQTGLDTIGQGVSGKKIVITV